MPVQTVSERLGHSSIAITGDVYAHVTAHAQAQAASAMGAILGEEEPTQPQTGVAAGGGEAVS